MSKKIVHFLRSGAAFGYGYRTGETGTIKNEDFATLQKKMVVRVPSDDELESYQASLKPAVAVDAKKPAAGKGKEKTKKEADGPGSDGDDDPDGEKDPPAE